MTINKHQYSIWSHFGGVSRVTPGPCPRNKHKYSSFSCILCQYHVFSAPLLSGLFCRLCFCRVFLASCLPTQLWGSSWGRALPPSHSSRWHRERQVHTNLPPAHPNCPGANNKFCIWTDLTQFVLWGRDEHPERARRSHRVTWSCMKCYFAFMSNWVQRANLASKTSYIWM